MADTRKNQEDIINKLQELQVLMDAVNTAISEDRQVCLDWYTELKAKWDEEDLTSEMAVVEREINNALSNMISATDKIPKIMEATSKIVSALIKERALLAISHSMEKEIDMNEPQDRLRLLEKSREIKALDDMVEKKMLPER